MIQLAQVLTDVDHWDRPDRYYWESAYGYRITVSKHDNQYRYRVFIRRDRRWEGGPVFDLPGQARDWCDDDLSKR